MSATLAYPEAPALRAPDPALIEHIRTPASHTFEYIHATEEEIDEAIWAIDAVKREPVVGELLQPLEDLGDETTLAHTDRVAVAAHIIGRRAGLSEEDLHLLDESSELHDIGKSAPDIQPLVHSTEKFEGEARDRFLATMARHPEEAVHRIMAADGLDDEHKLLLADIAGAHHQTDSPSSYGPPAKFKTGPAKILAVADTTDALASDRSYKPAFTEEAIRDILTKDFGSEPELLMTALNPDGNERFRRQQRVARLPRQVISL